MSAAICSCWMGGSCLLCLIRYCVFFVWKNNQLKSEKQQQKRRIREESHLHCQLFFFFPPFYFFKSHFCVFVFMLCVVMIITCVSSLLCTSVSSCWHRVCSCQILLFRACFWCLDLWSWFVSCADSESSSLATLSLGVCLLCVSFGTSFMCCGCFHTSLVAVVVSTFYVLFSLVSISACFIIHVIILLQHCMSHYEHHMFSCYSGFTSVFCTVFLFPIVLVVLSMCVFVFFLMIYFMIFDVRLVVFLYPSSSLLLFTHCIFFQSDIFTFLEKFLTETELSVLW